MTGHFARLLQVLLPHGGGTVMLMVEGYFDESGDLDQPPGIFCVSGYFIAVEAAKLMDNEWAAVLATHKIPYFHMVDCAHGAGIFKEMPVEERSEIVKKLIALIKKYTLEGFSIFAQAEAYEPTDDAPDVYSYCAQTCVGALRMFLQMNRVEGDVAYFFEQGHKNKGNAYNHIALKIKKPTDTLTFAAKEQIRLLQAADLLAWQSTKYAKDWFYPRLRGDQPKREPRKDFKSLVEHSHSFMHINIRGGHKSMGLEIWPLSKRSQKSVNMTIDDAGPIVFMREDGSDTPILPVDKTIGYRMGGAQFALVAFEGMEGKPFALAFDERRLFEALIGLVGATSIHEHSSIVPVFSVDGVEVQKLGSETIVRVKVRGGASLGFHLPPDVASQLKEKLSGG